MICFSAYCCQNIEYHLNADLANLAEWFYDNYLTLNTSKSKLVLFGGDSRTKTCQGIKLVIDHQNLESEDSIKYLGVVIQKNLTKNEHIESLIAKVNQRIGLIVKSYQTSIAFGCASPIIQCFDKTSLRLC